MTTTLSLTPPAVAPSRHPSVSPRDVGRGTVRAAVRIAVHGDPMVPPAVHEVSGDDARVVEDAFTDVAGLSALPVLAIREIVENLVHAKFAGATISILDGGREVRVSDAGPGIPDVARALTPGFSTADHDARRVIRGVGSGLPLAAALLDDIGGVLDIGPNLMGGLVVTMRAPVDATPPPPASGLSDVARRLLVLLLEIGPAAAHTLSDEIDTPLPDCGRELVLLEHRGYVSRTQDGRRCLTDAGSSLVATLF
jgi:Histidine kinase-, DNA gyrase B-, and HSP90-like ATPase